MTVTSEDAERIAMERAREARYDQYKRQCMVRGESFMTPDQFAAHEAKMGAWSPLASVGGVSAEQAGSIPPGAIRASKLVMTLSDEAVSAALDRHQELTSGGGSLDAAGMRSILQAALRA